MLCPKALAPTDHVIARRLSSVFSRDSTREDRVTKIPGSEPTRGGEPPSIPAASTPLSLTRYEESTCGVYRARESKARRQSPHEQSWARVRNVCLYVQPVLTRPASHQRKFSCATPSDRNDQYQTIIKAALRGAVIGGTYKRPSRATPILYFYNRTSC